MRPFRILLFAGTNKKHSRRGGHTLDTERSIWFAVMQFFQLQLVEKPDSRTF